MDAGSRHRDLTFPGKSDLQRRLPMYLLAAGVFFTLSILTVVLCQHYLLRNRIRVDSRLLTPEVLAGLVLLLALYYLTDGARLYLVVRAMGHHVPFRFLMKLVFVNIFFSNATPMATGGGFVQIYFLHRNGMSVGEATAATSLRTMLASLSMLILAPVFILLQPGLFDPFGSGNLFLLFACVAGLYVTVVILALFRARTFRSLLYPVLLFVHRKGLMSRRRFRKIFLGLSRELTLFTNGFRQFAQGPPLTILGAFLSTCCFLVALFSFSVLLIGGLGYRVPARTILAIQAVVTFFMYFTPTPGAVGLAESAYMLFFARFISRHDIALLTLSWRFLTIYIGMFLGILIAFREVFRVRRGRRR